MYRQYLKCEISPVLLNWTTTNESRLNWISHTNLIPRHPIISSQTSSSVSAIGISQFIADGDLWATTYLSFHSIKCLLIFLAGFGTLSPFLNQQSQVVKRLDTPYCTVATSVVRLVLHDNLCSSVNSKPRLLNLTLLNLIVSGPRAQPL